MLIDVHIIKTVQDLFGIGHAEIIGIDQIFDGLFVIVKILLLEKFALGQKFDIDDLLLPIQRI